MWHRYLSGEVLDVCMNLIVGRSIRDLATDANMKTLEKFLKGRRVWTKTTGRKTKTIYGLVPQAGNYQFEKEGVGMITIEVIFHVIEVFSIAKILLSAQRHYHLAHGITLKYPKLWGLRLTPKNSAHPNIVPAELCKILDGQIFRGKLPNSATRDIVKFATAKPHERLQRIHKSVRSSLTLFHSCVGNLPPIGRGVSILGVPC